MGNDSSRVDESPAHEVFIDEFEIGVFEITNAQYVKYLNQAWQRNMLIFDSEQVVAKKGRFQYFRLIEFLNIPTRSHTMRFIESEAEGGEPFFIVPGTVLSNFVIFMVSAYQVHLDCTIWPAMC